MSAYVVHPHHIRALVTWAGARNLTYYLPGTGHRAIAGDEDRVAQVLYAENVRSVAHRYRDFTPDDRPFVFRFERDAVLELSPIAVVKACHCLAYQSCEHDEWGTSEAKRIVDAIEARAVRLVPGYDAARWELVP
jgi:hypothetical protein